MSGYIYKAKIANRPAKPAPAKPTEALPAAPVAVGEAAEPEPDTVEEPVGRTEVPSSRSVKIPKLCLSCNQGVGLRGNGKRTSSGTSRVGGAGGYGSRVGSAGSRRGTGAGRGVDKGRLGAGEEAVDAAVDAQRVLLGSSGRAITLVAFGGALVGRDGLGGVGARITQACGLAVDIASVAGEGAAHGRSEASGNWGGRGGSAGGSSILGHGNGANGEEEDGGELHGGGGGGTVTACNVY